MKYRFRFVTLLLLLLSASCFAQEKRNKPASPAAKNLTLFGRGMYPGDDSTYALVRSSGFTTVILSSFYIRANGDMFSGDDGQHPFIHNGEYTGSKEWLTRVASLKKQSSVTRIEFLLEGRWYNQPPNTYDFIKDWTDPAAKAEATVVKGTAPNSTLFRIMQILKETVGVDAICIDDESVYDSRSIIELGEAAGRNHLHMTLCPYTRKRYWNEILTGSKKGLIDAVYLQCYDGGARNTIGPWHDSLTTTAPVYPIFLCRGAFSQCSTNHNSKTPAEIEAEMGRFKNEYAGMSGGAIWQMADVKEFIKMGCASKEPASGGATSVAEYLAQLRAALLTVL